MQGPVVNGQWAR